MSNSITIPKGATLSKLARQYKTNVNELLRVNPQIKNPNLIYAGATLHLPSAPSSSTQPTHPFVTPSPLLPSFAPQSSSSNPTPAAQPITRPTPTQQSAGAYQIKRGDTLSGLAQRYGTTVSELMKANPSIRNPNLIYAGRSLNLPGAGMQDYTNVQTIQEANDAINQGQAGDIAVGDTENEPPVRDSFSDLSDALKIALNKGGTPTNDISGIADTIKPSGVLPEVPSFEDKFTELRTTYGIDTLESELNDLNAVEADIQATMRIRRDAEKGKPVAMNVIEGRVGEVERQEMERLDSIQRQINYKTSQLNTKYKIVDTYMQLADMDYDNAVQSYNNELSTNISIFNVLKGIDESQKTEIERVNDNARASMQIIYNQLSSGGVSIDDLSADQQNLITKLEMQAGLPTGFFKTMQVSNPKSNIVSTTNWIDESNNKYVSVISRSSTGALSTQNILLGKAKASTSLTPEQKREQDLADDESKEISNFRKDAADLQMKMSANDITWSMAWNNLHTKYPKASTETIDNVLGLKYREKYDKE